MAKIKSIKDFKKVSPKMNEAAGSGNGAGPTPAPLALSGLARGRPRIPVIKGDILSFRLNTKQYDAVRAAAKRFGMSPHEWCRKIILDKLFKR